MSKKKNIGFIINFSHKRWLGGSNYFSNLFEGIYLHTQNSITIFTGIEKEKLNPDFKKYNIIYLSILNPNKKINILINYLRMFFLVLFNRDFILEQTLIKYNINILSHSFPLGKNSKIKSIYWIPDLQHLQLKELFSIKNKFKRWLDIYIASKNASVILFSSKTVRQIFLQKYPNLKKKLFVLNFLNKLPKKQPISNLAKKFKNYFLISNQFWIHKNYDLILKGLVELKKQKLNPYILSTGTKFDWRSSSYYSNLLKKIRQNKLSNFIILGKVSREEQLGLMLNANYLINPSRSEGWNSAIEEAKSLKTNVLASNLDVHKEQLGKKGIYFGCDDYLRFSYILKKKYLKTKKKKIRYNNLYNLNKSNFKKFALSYQNILWKIIK
jgi:glycosyltransferase involved in cell wall biosynthesis